MVPSSDAETSAEVINYRPDGCLVIERRRHGTVDSDHWNDHENRDIEPVQVLVPVRCRPSLVDNMGWGRLRDRSACKESSVLVHWSVDAAIHRRLVSVNRLWDLVDVGHD